MSIQRLLIWSLLALHLQINAQYPFNEENLNEDGNAIYGGDRPFLLIPLGVENNSPEGDAELENFASNPIMENEMKADNSETGDDDSEEVLETEQLIPIWDNSFQFPEETNNQEEIKEEEENQMTQAWIDTLELTVQNLEAENVFLKDQIRKSILSQEEPMQAEESENVSEMKRNVLPASAEKDNSEICLPTEALTDNCATFKEVFGLQMDAEATHICRTHQICYACAYPETQAMKGCDELFQQQVSMACNRDVSKVAKCHFEADRMLHLMRGLHEQMADDRLKMYEDYGMKALCDAPCTVESVMFS